MIDSCSISSSPKVADLLSVPAAFFGLENLIFMIICSISVNYYYYVKYTVSGAFSNWSYRPIP